MTPADAEQVKAVGDGVSIIGVIATLAGWLPSIAALLSIVWTVLRILETETVRGWIARFRR